MAIDIGDIIEVGWESEFNAQRFLNVMHYRKQVNQTVPTTAIQEEAQIAVELSTGGAGTLVDLYRDCLPSNLTLHRVRVQVIRPLRLVPRYGSIEAAGTAATTAQQGNLSAVITFKSDFAGRNQQGSFHVPALPKDMALGGYLADAGFIADFNALGAKLIQSITPAGTGAEYLPVILHPNGHVPDGNGITDYICQSTVRVMRRRTVGVGK